MAIVSKEIKSFKDLVVWQKSHELTLEIYKITLNFPSEEKFGLTSQMRRAAYSIPANIVEGHSRKSKKEFLQFLSIAKGSLEELKYFIILSSDLEYINNEITEQLESMSEEVSKMLYAFTKSLSNIH
ncbi:MAG: four helix bundle protein [Bacteroidetes bacterium]|nr:four helix bundle protein [Bacteroidota bacterium]MBU1680658.1 four helix bundle protein [Bacteroidota bacterium]MBU2505380.1 four helix bundle protein [Bacteroidota bacterium]